MAKTKGKRQKQIYCRYAKTCTENINLRNRNTTNITI